MNPFITWPKVARTAGATASAVYCGRGFFPTGIARHLASLAAQRSSILRGLAAFLGGFTLLNFAGGLVARDFDCNIWWIDFRPLARPISHAILLPAAGALLAFAVRPYCGEWRRSATCGLVGTVALVALINATHFYILLARGEIRAGVPIPLSILVCAALLWIVWGVRKPSPAAPLGWGDRIAFGGTIAACAVALPLAQMWFFGKTDYRRPADAIVVFGARAYADGRPSLALSDRVTTACRLYHEGYADRLVFSGGPGDGDTDEPHAMRRQALTLSVPDSAILLDPGGLNTDATGGNPP